MGIWASFQAMVGGRYRYRPGPVGLGVGVSNMALEQPGRAIDADFYSPRYNVRGALVTTLPMSPNPGAPSVPAFDLRGNGVYLSGDMALQSLIEGAKRGAD